MLRLLRHRPWSHDRGASAVEYGLLVAAIAAVIVGIVFAMGGMIQGAFEQTEQCIREQLTAPNCDPPGGN